MGTLTLFPNFVRSLASSINYNDGFELIITDWESTDWPIKEWIEDAIPEIPIHIVTIKSNGFSAGKGRNIAADNANGSVLFFVDADMLVNRAVIQEGINIVNSGGIYYPLVRYITDPGGKEIIHQGGGNLFVSKYNFNRSKRWPEYWSHGFEDTDFYSDISRFGPVITSEKFSIIHQWHPQETAFKNKHASSDPQKIDIVNNRRFHYNKVEENKHNKLIDSIDRILKNDPNTTHSTLNAPAKADNRGLLL